MIDDDRVVSGEAELPIDVHGLDGARHDCFLDITSFVEGLAAEQMCSKALLFLQGEGENATSSMESLRAKVNEWKREGFRLKLAVNF